LWFVLAVFVWALCVAAARAEAEAQREAQRRADRRNGAYTAP